MGDSSEKKDKDKEYKPWYKTAWGLVAFIIAAFVTLVILLFIFRRMGGNLDMNPPTDYVLTDGKTEYSIERRGQKQPERGETFEMKPVGSVGTSE